MNIVRIVLVALMVFMVGLLAVLALTGVNVVRQDEPQWAETLEHLQQNAVDKSRQSATYLSYARCAAQEHRSDAEHLFRAMSAAECIHAKNMQRALERLGGRFCRSDNGTDLEMVHGADSVFSTRENLLRSLRREDTLSLKVYPAAIDRAVAEDARYAARVLLWIAGTDMKHARMIQFCLDSPDVSCDSVCYWVCPTCGNTFTLRIRERYCPFCMTHSVRFLSF